MSHCQRTLWGEGHSAYSWSTDRSEKLQTVGPKSVHLSNGLSPIQFTYRLHVSRSPIISIMMAALVHSSYAETFQFTAGQETVRMPLIALGRLLLMLFGTPL